MNKIEVLHVSFAKFYRVGGVTFEWHNYFGPTVLNRHTEKPRDYRNISLRNWAEVSRFSGMSDAEKENYRIF
ncbi:hypothetical protein B621_gp41 [Marinomonas phage P12026]|uniref:hypothetical protein n=1 Tax=Marinomonas phage P12026 TaxID=1176423 RepID=UPI0002688F53|nr:hypothetical protein B621_gp41 [Marinomonas phage P12026]AFM54887.1 hypothetical protein P12026_41 [Marinomonas phage P12026]